MTLGTRSTGVAAKPPTRGRRAETCPEGVEACIEDLERRIGGIARNLGHGSACDHTNTETESPSSTQITRFTVPRKFKQPHLDSYNGSGSPVDHVWTYKA